MLTGRLRAAADWKDDKPYRDADLFRLAADRIEQLQAVLEEIAGDCHHQQDGDLACCKARRALGDKHE